MKEIPILFSTAMVQAELDGRKTMTRRLKGLELINMEPDKWTPIEVDSPFKLTDIYWLEGEGERVAIRCPYGQPKDLLWVRETWAPYLRGTDGNGFIELIKYKADGVEIPFKHVKDYAELGWHNRPGIHMNKEYARIWLQVTNVRVERLQDISEEDAQAEGIKSAGCEDHLACPSKLCINECVDKDSWWNYMAPDGEDFPCFTAKESFESLWHSINGKESWEANPWVWIVSFKVLSTTGKPSLVTEKQNNE